MPEDSFSIVRTGHPSLLAVQEVAVLDPLRRIDEGPVEAPDTAVQTKGVDDCRNEWVDIRVRKEPGSHPEGSRQLDDGIGLATE